MSFSIKDPILNSPIIGFAHHRIILDEHGQAVDYEFLEVNSTFEALTGLEREKIIGKTLRQAIPGIENSEFDWIGFYGEIALNTTEKEFEQYSEPLKKWYRVHAYSTEKFFFTTMFIDISSAKQKEEELRYKSTIIENIHDSVVATDAQFRITYINSSAEKLYGYSQEELLGKSPDIFNAEPMSQEIQQELYSVVSSGNVYENTSINRRKDSSLFYCEYKVKPINDKSGKITAFVGVQRDITERKRKESELQATKENYRLISENAPVGLFRFQLTPPDFYQFTFLSDKISDITGVSIKTIKKDFRALHDKIHPDYKENFEQAMKESAENLSAFRQVFLFNKNSGDIWIEVRSNPEKTEDGTIVWNGVFIEVDKLKRAEETINNERERLQNIIEGTNAGTWECNLQTGETLLNEKWAKVLGYTLEEISPVNINTWLSRLHPDDYEAAQTALNKHISGELEYYDAESRMRHKDGSWVWVHGKGKVISRTTDGEPLWMFGTHVDINDKKKAEEEVQKTRDQFQSLVNNLPGITYRCKNDPDWTMFFVSAKVDSIIGYTAEELLYNKKISYNQVIYPNDREKVANAIEYGIVTRSPWVVEYRIVHKNGDILWVSERGMAIYNEKQEVKYLDGFIHDISDRKQVEDKLITMGEERRILLDNIQTQIWYLKDETTYGAINKAHADFNGVKIEDLAFKNLYDIFPEDVVEVCKQSNSKVFRTKKAVYTEEWVPHFSGEKRLISIVKTPKLDSKGNVDYVVCSAEDITERKRAELQLEKNLRFQQTVADISSRFVKTTKKTLDKDINYMLSLIGKLFQVDRSYFFTFSENLDKMTNTHEWCSESVPPQMDNIQNHSTRLLPWFMKKIKSRHIVHIKDVEALPVEATAERNEFKSQGIKSLIAIAVKTSDKLWGFIGFDAVKSSYIWSESEIDNLIVLANIIGDLILKLENERFLIKARELAETREMEARHHKIRLDTILSNTPAVIYTYTINSDGVPQLTYINDNVKNVLGYPPEKYIRSIDFWRSCVHPEDLPKIQLKLSGENITNEYRFKDKNGNYHWLLDNQKILKKDQNCTEIIGTWWDITCQKEAELELKKSKNQLDMFFEQSFSGFFFMMLDKPVDWKNSKNKEALLDYIMSHQRITKVNQAMLDQYRAKEDDFLGLTPNDLFAHNLSHARYIWKGLFEKGRWHVETEEQKMDGTPMIVDGDYILLYDEQGRITGHFGVQLDVTAQKQAQKAVVESELRFAVAIEGSEAGIWDWDMVENRVVFSTQWKAMLGYTDKEVENTFNGWKNLWHPDDVASIEKSVADHLNGLTKRYEIVHRCRHKNGKWCWLLTRGKILRDQTGTPYRWIGTNVDITKQKNAEEEMKKAKKQAETASKAKSEFLANMSHEIRTPLNGVIGFTNLLLSTPLNNTQKQYVENSNISAHSLLGIINDILDFSKIEAGKLDLDPVKTDFIELIENSADIIKYQSSQKGLELLLDIQPDLPRFAKIDPVRLKQIIVNLLSNAVKFTEKGEIELKVTFKKMDVKKGKYCISVRDTGIGITKKQQERLFKAFSQADTSTTRKYGGTGLGLIIGNMLAEKMGGKIKLQSEAGKGTTFYFSIITEYEEGEKRIHKEIKKVKKILVVDDNKNNRIILEHNFNYWGMESASAGDAVSALRVIETSEPFDVIVVDYQMPYINGLELVKMIREKLKVNKEQLPAILLFSSVDDTAIKKECNELGVMYKLVKPVKAQELYDVLEKVYSQPDFFELPENTELKEKKREIITTDKETGHYVVMVAEDVTMNMKLIKIILHNLVPGIVIIEAKNGKEAVEKVEDNNIDLILMDIQMPEMDGLEAACLIKKQKKYKELPIIALTAGATKTEKEKCLNAGMDDFLVKPVDENKLNTVLKKFLLTE